MSAAVAAERLHYCRIDVVSPTLVAGEQRLDSLVGLGPHQDVFRLGFRVDGSHGLRAIPHLRLVLFWG